MYLSLGSLGSADVDLMQRLVGMLADAPYRVIVSKGPQADLFDLAPNMWGEEFVPQTRILPHVDVVITHGGNNTVTECFDAGVPMVVLPLFWDQYDNAQRVDELGFGTRLDTYRCSREQLTGAIHRLLSDREPARADARDRGPAPDRAGNRQGGGPDRTARRHRRAGDAIVKEVDDMTLDLATVQDWLDRYILAWESLDPSDIEALFTDVVTYYAEPYATPFRTREAIVDAWRADPDPPGSWRAAYAAQLVDGDRAVATGRSTYFEEDGTLRDVFHNVFLLTFGDHGRCVEYREWYMAEPKEEA